MTEKHKSPAVIFIICSLCLFWILCFGTHQFSYAQENKEEEAFFVAKKAFGDGFYDVSLGLLERFSKNYPDSKKWAEANLLIGECYFHQSRFLDALNQFNSLLNQAQANNLEDAVFYWIAEVNFRSNNFSRAAQYYQKVCDNFPKSPYLAASLYSLGWCLYQDHLFDKSLKYFLLVEEKFPKESYAQDSRLKIVECLYNLKDYNRLRAKLRNYLKLYAKDAAKSAYLYFYLAEADYYLDNYEAAAQEYTRAFSNSGDDKIKALSKLGLGWARLKLKQYKEAENNFSQVKKEDLEKSSRNILLLGRAVLMAETKSYVRARDLYKQLIDFAGEEPAVVGQAYLGLADALYNMAEYKEAVNIYKQALEKLPQSDLQDLADKLHYGLAWVFLKQGEFKEAIAEFQKIANLTEDKTLKVAALCQIGDAYQDSGDFNKAIETYDSILKNYPDSFYGDYVQYQSGLALMKLSNYEGAILAFKTLKNNFPQSKLLDDATYALGLAYFQREDYNSSKEIFEQFKNEFKDSNLNSQVSYLLGTSLYNLGKFSEAIEVFKDIIRAYGQDAELAQKSEYEIADCLYRMGNEKEAMARFKVLRSKYPDSKLTPEVMWWLGEYYYRHNDMDLARRYFSSLITDFSKSSLVNDAYYALGSSCASEGRYDEALKNFQKIIERGKSDLAGTAAIAVGDIYLKQEKIDSALKTYKEVYDNYRNLGQLVLPKIADSYFRMNNYTEAINYYTQCLELVPVREMANIQFKIAEAKQAQGRSQEAIEDYLKTSYLYSENNQLAVKSLLRAAAIYEDKQDYKEALKVYRKIAAMDLAEAKYAKERIGWINTHYK